MSFDSQEYNTTELTDDCTSENTHEILEHFREFFIFLLKITYKIANVEFRKYVQNVLKTIISSIIDYELFLDDL